MLAIRSHMSQRSERELFSDKVPRKSSWKSQGLTPLPLTPAIDGLTEISGNYAKKLHLVAPSVAIESQVPASRVKRLKNEIDGTVLQIDGESVECEVYKSNKNQIINMPKSLFHDDVGIGFAFSLQLDNSSGYRRPLIKAREIDVSKMAKGVEAIATLISKL